ncbi:helix-turn-helix domain-containing protein [Agrobacterium tumefaciens]|uniref:GlxA family transcriptional regulator n=1 Tax=Agrobacterium TaxID=357 RepID=UPI00115F035E|nr:MULTISPECIES: helix-turn-helix domain-containing protein [Agrobacterium]MDA5241554.1 helix-turn-helix domain-containing protein [Agrobacterium sp. MAFF310724]MDA5249324.1 helix-turn-helix domain-containing protein [Agrobacterium sp. MAFF210268]MDO3445667.1 helix-turn-helix domain-containing protein [Agrobacterium sp. V1]TRB13775.1 helix-turn-helix domain-containing protein [Agrobacterium tumefaciens]UNZ54310.1 helix-turn-helix domain-containing protein [Agrobacterium tumefaciens]
MAPVQIGILLYPGAQVSAVLGLTDMFKVACRVADNADSATLRLRVRHLRIEDDEEPVVVFDSDTDATGEDTGPSDVLILPPSLEPPISAEAAAPLARWLRTRHGEGSALASVCAGAFLLAETGLLAGRTITTHWASADAFRNRFPGVELDTDRLIIDSGDIISVGGLMAWTDLGLKLVERFLSPVTMVRTARMLLIDPPGREQRFYSRFAPRLNHGDAAIVKAQHFLQAKEGKEARLAILAEQAGLEQRTFLRRFQKATGMTATDYAQRLRVAKAQELLQFRGCPVERIAWEVGYADPGAFRKIFFRIIGLTPGEYRERFQARAGTLEDGTQSLP